jgi:enoyl-CoA hydratase/carnithine racemase
MAGMSSPLVTLEVAGPVGTLWLDRPDKRNALDATLMRDLAATLDQVRDDAALRVLVLRGRGPVFSSGIDHSLLLEVFQKSRTVPFLHLHHDLQDTFHRMSRLGKPIVAALHGACAGMALELALAADVRIASQECVLGLPEIAFGIVPDVGGTTRLVRAVGEPRARELVLTGRLVKAGTAERYGLIHEVAEDAADLERRVARTVGILAAHPPAAINLAKTLVQASAETDAATSFRFEGVVQQALLGQPDLMSHFPAALAFIKARFADAE